MSESVNRSLKLEEEQRREHLETTWKDFKSNLFDIHQDFDVLEWIRRLALAFISFALLKTRLYHVMGHLIQFIPMISLGLIAFVLWTYYMSLHTIVILELQGNLNLQNYNFSSNIHITMILLDMILKFIPIHLGGLISFNYWLTVFTSPGICCTSTVPTSNLSSEERLCNIIQWRSMEGQGGMCYFNIPYDLELEQNLQNHFNFKYYDGNDATSTEDGDELTIVYIPSPQSSFCYKCNVQRPPRCHHCSKCNRCVLQMDHHCYWMNNCIGYNNYRTFLLTIIFLVIGCWYGVLLLVVPFWKRYAMVSGDSNSTTWMLYPLWSMMFTDRSMNIQQDDLLQLIFYLLFGAGSFLSVLLYSHIRLIASGMTTIERAQMIRMEHQSILNRKIGSEKLDHRVSISYVNIFDQGFRKNLKQVFGENALYHALLPIKVSTPMPFLPTFPSTLQRKSQ